MAKDRKASCSDITYLDIPINYPEIVDNRVLDTWRNLKQLLDAHKIQVRWNMMFRSREITIPEINHFFDEKENADLAYIYDLATNKKMPNARLDKHLDVIAWNNVYHPIASCITNKPWDKIPRLNQFIATIKATNHQLAKVLIKRWMMSAVAAVFSEKGFSNQGVLVLEGKQNIGKTRWVKSLDPILCGAVKEGLLLDPSNKDHVITASQCWIAELGELDGTLRKSDIAALKAYITNTVDILRFPYKEKNSHLARRTAFVATVNEKHFLNDTTGNRRWWTIEVESINLNHNLDMQQVWAEVYDFWSKNNQTWLHTDEMDLLNETNNEHELIDPFEEKALSYFDWCDNWQNLSVQTLTTSQVLERLGYRSPSKNETTRMGGILVKLTGKPPKRSAQTRLHTLPMVRILNR